MYPLPNSVVLFSLPFMWMVMQFVIYSVTHPFKLYDLTVSPF